MKAKKVVTKIKSSDKNYNGDYEFVEFAGKHITGYIFEDGSGELKVKTNDDTSYSTIWHEDATHKIRAKRIRKLHKQLCEAVKELDELDKKLDTIYLYGKRIKNLE